MLNSTFFQERYYIVGESYLIVYFAEKQLVKKIHYFISFYAQIDKPSERQLRINRKIIVSIECSRFSTNTLRNL